ncbi:MAG: hypothetical protein ACI4PF_04525 [Christensenellales bacterium]
MEKSRKGLGVVLGLFIGLLGLLFLLAFPQGSNERDTFIKGWTIGFIIQIVLGVVGGILFGVVFAGMFSSAMDSIENMETLSLLLK